MFIFTVPQGTCCIVEMFGKPCSVRQSGLQFTIPLLQNIRRVPAEWGTETHRKGIYIELTEQTLDTMARQYTTQDNVNVTANCVIRWRIYDVKKAVYEVSRLHKSLVETVLNELRSLIGSMKLDDVLTKRSTIADRVAANVSNTLSRWGVLLSAVEIQELRMDDATADAMRQIMEAERRSKAIIAESEGESLAIERKARASKLAAVLKAEGEAEAVRLAAEAEKAYLQQLSEVIGAEAAAKVLMNRQMLQCYGTAVQDPAAKVFIPAGLPSIVDSGK